MRIHDLSSEAGRGLSLLGGGLLCAALAACGAAADQPGLGPGAAGGKADDPSVTTPAPFPLGQTLEILGQADAEIRYGAVAGSGPELQLRFTVDEAGDVSGLSTDLQATFNYVREFWETPEGAKVDLGLEGIGPADRFTVPDDRLVGRCSPPADGEFGGAYCRLRVFFDGLEGQEEITTLYVHFNGAERDPATGAWSCFGVIFETHAAEAVTYEDASQSYLFRLP